MSLEQIDKWLKQYDRVSNAHLELVKELASLLERTVKKNRTYIDALELSDIVEKNLRSTLNANNESTKQ